MSAPSDPSEQFLIFIGPRRFKTGTAAVSSVAAIASTVITTIGWSAVFLFPLRQSSGGTFVFITASPTATTLVVASISRWLAVGLLLRL